LKSAVHVLCSSHDKGKDTRDACAVGCIGCMKCKKVCPVDAPVIENFLSHIDVNKCVNCGKCVQECPTSAIGDFRKRRDAMAKQKELAESANK
jgi:electron transport complex protein RnfB